MNKVIDDIYYVGVNDHKIDLFEGQYKVPNGISYNSYVILDEEIAILDTVDKHFTAKWLGNIKNSMNDRNPNYLIIQHMEPDHSANILNLLEIYPDITLIGNIQTFKMIEQFFNISPKNKKIVTDGETLSLGKHTLTFIFAPMVHWPEVMVTYDQYGKVLFSADGFGKFGALDVEEEWACEARRYYFGIVGKYGVQVQKLLQKIRKLEISIIAPLHGPVLKGNLGYYINLYGLWSKYDIESKGIVIAYTSIYGNTKEAVLLLEKKLREYGYNDKIVMNDLARCDMHQAIASAFRYGKLVLATISYNNSIFPYMKEYINHLIERNYCNRTIAFIENGTWAPIAIKAMKEMFNDSKNITYTNNNVTILSSLNGKSIDQVQLLAKELI